jgi:hypothetical protein
MRLQILQVPDCPNAAVLAARLAELAGAWPGLRVTREVVTTQDDAERLGMTGSPTLLADGTDPSPAPGRCRGSRAAFTATSRDGPHRRHRPGNSARRSPAPPRRPALTSAPARAATGERRPTQRRTGPITGSRWH